MSRVPVLGVFATTVLAQLAGVFLIKESVEHLLTGNEEDTHGHGPPKRHALYTPAVFISILSQLVAAYAVNNEPMHLVLTAAHSSWMQVKESLYSSSLCYFIAGTSSRPVTLTVQTRAGTVTLSTASIELTRTAGDVCRHCMSMRQQRLILVGGRWCHIGALLAV